MSRSNPIKPESPSKKLRDIFFSLWKQDNEGFEDFDSYYESKMEKIIKHYRKMIKH